MSRANRRDSEFLNSQEVRYRQWPATVDGDIEEGVWNGAGFDVTTRPLDADEVAAWGRSEEYDARQSKGAAVDAAVAALRQWAADAQGTTVTSGNAVATLQVVVDRLGVFFDRFADLIESDKVR